MLRSNPYIKIILLLLIIIIFSSLPSSAAVYEYDELNRLTSVTYPNGQKITYTYDAGGNMLSVDSDSGDTTPPIVKSTDPVNGATGVSVNAKVYVTFSETVVESVYFSEIYMKNIASDSVVDCTYSINEDILTIDPVNDLSYSVNYAVYVPAGAVKDRSGNSLADDYSFSFTTVESPYAIRVTSPNGGELWQAGATREITWSYAGEGCSSDARISLYKGGVYQYTIVGSVPLATGSYNWSIPGNQATGDDYKVRVTCNADINVYDLSDADFTISKPITVTSPNGGEVWQAGATKEITWNYAGDGCSSDARISLYKGGVYQYTIVSSVYLESGSYSWTIPGSQAAGDDYKVRVTCNANINVYDLSDDTFTISKPITVISPNGGEVWQAGATREITWSYAGEGCSSDARISLYKGGVYQYTIVSSVYLESGSYSWTITGSQTIGEDYKVRVTCNANINVYDLSDADFTISKPITVISPNGGEVWQAGATREITWSYAGDGCSSDARISLYKGVVYQYTIVSSVYLESGTYSWTIPGSQAAGDDYKVRVTCNANINVYDLSDATFAINPS